MGRDRAIEGRALRRSLRRTERRRTLLGLGLALPLIAYLVAFFLLPLGSILLRAIANPELGTVMPETAAALRAMPAPAVPGEAVFATLAGEMAAAREGRTLPEVGRRLNNENAGYRTLILATARKLPETPDGGWRATLVAIDPAWGELPLWSALRRAAFSWTDLYLLGAVDRERAPDDSIVRVPSDRAVYLDILWRTLQISLVVTLACLLLGYPLAYRLATLPESWANLLLILVLLPFWTSLLVRTASWIVLLQREGPINQLLQLLHLTTEPLQLVFNRTGVYVAMTHVLLPFMVLPLYSVMRGIPPSYMRAARSLGAPFPLAFRRVYLPLSLPGVGAGAMLVFILSLGYYITPALVGGAADQMISYFIAFFTLQTVNWGMAAALGTILLTATILLYLAFVRLLGTERLRLG